MRCTFCHPAGSLLQIARNTAPFLLKGCFRNLLQRSKLFVKHSVKKIEKPQRGALSAKTDSAVLRTFIYHKAHLLQIGRCAAPFITLQVLFYKQEGSLHLLAPCRFSFTNRKERYTISPKRMFQEFAAAQQTICKIQRQKIEKPQRGALSAKTDSARPV